MPAVLRGLLASSLARRHDLTAIPTHLPGGVRARLGVFVRALVTLVRWSRRAPAGPVHVHMTVRGSMHRKTLVVALARALGRPVVLHVHSGAVELGTYHARLDPLRRAAFRWAFRRAARVLAVSGVSGHVLETRYGARGVEVLPNAVAQVPAAAEAPPGTGVPTILFLGGFANPVKGGTVLLEALPALHAACPHARVELAGPGEPSADLPASGEGTLCWLGWLDDAGKHAALAEADLFVLPSTSEGLPVALLEAMAHGKGIVATRVGGVPEVLEDGREGVLVAPGDPDALADALARLAGDPQRARELGAAARRRVAALSPERIAERLDAVYREVTVGSGSPHGAFARGR